MTPERFGIACAVILCALTAAVLGLLAGTGNLGLHPEALGLVVALFAWRLWYWHRAARRPASAAGDRFWRHAVEACLPDMVRAASIWTLQIRQQLGQGIDEPTVISTQIIAGSAVSRPWGVEVPLWPPNGYSVSDLSNLSPKLLTALAKPMKGRGETLALVEVVEDTKRPGRGLLRALPRDPFLDPRPWEWALDDGPMGTKLGKPLAGYDRYGDALYLPGVGKSIAVGGVPGFGKSFGLNGYCRQWFPTRTQIVVFDTVGSGVDFAHMAPRVHGPYLHSGDVLPVLSAFTAERAARVAALAAAGMPKLEDDEDFEMLSQIMGRPITPVCLVIDEFHDAFGAGTTASGELARIIKEGRKAGMWAIIATQRFSANLISTDLRALIAAGVCYKVGNLADAEMILGKLPQGLQVGPWNAIEPGVCYVKGSEVGASSIGAGGLVAMRSLTIDGGKKGAGFPEVRASALATAHMKVALDWLPAPTVAVAA